MPPEPLAQQLQLGEAGAAVERLSGLSGFGGSEGVRVGWGCIVFFGGD